MLNNSHTKGEVRFLRISFALFGLILILVSLMLGRDFGDISWNMPRPIGIAAGVLLVFCGAIMTNTPFLVWLKRYKVLDAIIFHFSLFGWCLLCVGVSLEMGTRLLVWVKPEVGINTPDRFWESRPAPYKDATFFSPEFVKEMRGVGALMPRNFTGTYFNIINGRRKTSFQPLNARNTIYVFGGSNVFGAETPDEYTIASLLQVFLNERFGNRYKVENLGTKGGTTSLWIERLNEITLTQGDIIIFYGGANDTGQLFYDDGDVSIRDNPKVPVVVNLWRSFNTEIYQKMGGHSEFVNIFMYPYDLVNAPTRVKDRQTLNALAPNVGNAYRANILEAHQYSTQVGAVFFHFLQPTLFTQSTFSQYEKFLLSKKFIVYPGWQDTFEIVYPELIKVTADLYAAGLYSFDTTKSLDRRDPGQEFFVDSIHVNHEANKLIAKAISEKIIDNIKE